MGTNDKTDRTSTTGIEARTVKISTSRKSKEGITATMRFSPVNCTAAPRTAGTMYVALVLCVCLNKASY